MSRGLGKGSSTAVLLARSQQPKTVHTLAGVSALCVSDSNCVVNHHGRSHKLLRCLVWSFLSTIPTASELPRYTSGTCFESERESQRVFCPIFHVIPDFNVRSAGPRLDQIASCVPQVTILPRPQSPRDWSGFEVWRALGCGVNRQFLQHLLCEGRPNKAPEERSEKTFVFAFHAPSKSYPESSWPAYHCGVFLSCTSRDKFSS